MVRFCFLIRLAFAALAVMVPGWITAQTSPPSPPEETVPASTLVFVPYDRTTGPRLGMDQSVLLPYAEFLKLKGTNQGQTDSPDFQPIASISQSSYKGVLAGGVAKFDAEFTIETLARAQDSIEVQLPLRNASVESASVDTGEATLAPLGDQAGLRVIMRGPGRRVVRMRLATPVGAEGSERLFNLGFPRAAASLLQLGLSEDVVISSNAASVPINVVADAGGARIEAACGSLDGLAFSFSPRRDMSGADAQTRIESVQTVKLFVGATSIRVRADIKIAVLAGRTSSLKINIPPDLNLVGITGSFVKSWTFSDAERVATVSLVREVAESFDLVLEAQRTATDEGAANFSLADFRLADSVRESGTLLLIPDEAVSVWAEKLAGLEPATLESPGNPALRGFRFGQAGWTLEISRKRVLARVRSDGVILYEITDDFARLKTSHTLSVSGGGIFGASFEIPEGYELREAGPQELVAGFRAQGRTVQVNFRSEQRATLNVDLRLERSRTPAETQVSIEPVRALEVEEDAGYVVVAAPLALRVTEKSSGALGAMDVRTLHARLQPLLSADIQPVLGYRYFAPSFAAQVVVEKQRPRLTCETNILASISPSLLSVSATLNYNVEFSATDTFQLLVPASAGNEVRFDGAGLREKFRAEPSADADSTTWTIRLQSPVIGRYALSASFDEPIVGGDAAQSAELMVPRIRAAGVVRETGSIGVARGENLEVGVLESTGLEARDTKELPATLEGAFLGFRYFDPGRVTLKLRLVRHELESMLGALIRRMHIESVLSDQREATHEVILEVQNNREQYLELNLPEGMKIWSAFVRGVPVRPTLRERDKANLIELTKSETQDAAFRVRLILRETLPGGPLGQWGRLRFLPPAPMNIPVLRTTWKLYLPARWRYVEFEGDMRLEKGNERPWIEPAAELLLSDLPAEVAGGIARPEIRPVEAVVGTDYNRNETDEEKRGRIQAAALEIPLVREGVQYEFSSLAGVGDIRIRFWKTRALVVLQGSFALLVFFGLLFVMGTRRSLARGLAAVFAMFILASLMDGLAGRLAATAFAASGFALVLAGGSTLWRRLRESAKAELSPRDSGPYVPASSPSEPESREDGEATASPVSESAPMEPEPKVPGTEPTPEISGLEGGPEATKDQAAETIEPVAERKPTRHRKKQG